MCCLSMRSHCPLIQQACNIMTIVEVIWTIIIIPDSNSSRRDLSNKYQLINLVQNQWFQRGKMVQVDSFPRHACPKCAKGSGRFISNSALKELMKGFIMRVWVWKLYPNVPKCGTHAVLKELMNKKLKFDRTFPYHTYMPKYQIKSSYQG